MQFVIVVEPSSSRPTVPPGVIAVPVEVSLTNMLHESLEFTGTVTDAQVSVVDTLRGFTVMLAVLLLGVCALSPV